MKSIRRELFPQVLDESGYKGAISLPMPPVCFMEHRNEKYRQGMIMEMNVEEGAYRQRIGIFFRELPDIRGIK